MQLVIDDTDLSRLKPETRADLLATLFPAPGAPLPVQASTVPIDWDNVVDLSPGEVADFMSRTSLKTKAGLRVFAEKGPVLLANALEAAGIDNYGHFQGRVTLRTRTVKRTKKKVYLFGWDDWTVGENAGRGYGHYGVTSVTHRSLREYFQLD